MKIKKLDLTGDPSIGIFSLTTQNKTFVPNNTQEKNKKKIKETLETKVIKTNIYNSPLLGLFASANEKGIILPKTTYEEEKKAFKEHFQNVKIIKEYTALGNLVTVNENGFIASPALSKKAIKEMEKTFGVEGKKVTINGLDVTGSCVSATKNGFLANPETSEETMKKISGTLGTEGITGTINYGNPYTKSGILANSKGVLVGSSTSNFELGRVDEAFIGER